MHNPKKDEKRRSIGLFGGTFDPIHYGHLRSALEIYDKLKLDEMRMIPCKLPPHRPPPKADAALRLEMVRQALQGSPLQLDDREMFREGPSFTVDTLLSFRAEFPKASLCLVVGLDAFLGLTSWHQWTKIIQLANIIVMYRNGWSIPDFGMSTEILETYALQDNEKITQFASGKIIKQAITTLDISATKVRALVKAGQSPRFLCPDSVLKYIEEHKLYDYPNNNVIIHTPMEVSHV